ncbi:hypothetical protein QYE76_026309 [Lolium multiflorum]|uniref:Uncharacterized protein n=1 Tax=Lolium multiflorum TaxID=4521 RepID=A0AAD8VV12_LOLMU|nr:hypothetical protein QYE76_026309 [Lolium multiflorum]
MVDLSHSLRREPGFSFGVNMAGLGTRHGKDKAESSHSRGKEKEEADPRDRPQHDNRRYLTEEEVRSVRYQRPLSAHLLNKYEQQYDRRRRYDVDDERYRRSDADDRRYRRYDRDDEGLEADLQKRFEHHDPHELINELKTIFETHAAVECYEASKHFFSCMMEEGSSISEHMLAMTGHAKKLSDLGIVIPNRLGINRVLQSLPPSYKNFVMNYNMQNMNKELPELFSMLKSAEIEIKKEHQVLMVNKTTSFKKQGKSKGKNKKSGKKAATPPVKPKTGPKPDAECYQDGLEEYILEA